MEERLDLSGADLQGVDLHLADLNDANLTRSNLTNANLIDADLRYARLYDTLLNGTQFAGALFGYTIIANRDLSGAIGLDLARHLGTSSVGLDSILLSSFDLPRVFLEKVGLPAGLLTTLRGHAINNPFYSCFIAYGEPNKVFGEKLYEKLMSEGVDCWMYSKDRIPGEPTQREIDNERRAREKFIALCSAPGLLQDGFLKEIENQVDQNPDKPGFPRSNQLSWI